MIFLQPFIQFQTPLGEPFKWNPLAVPNQIETIRQTLEIAKGATPTDKATFTIFPEYSVPGIEGYQIIDAIVNSAQWPAETIVCAGIDGLSYDDFRLLCNSGIEVHHDNAPGQKDDPGDVAQFFHLFLLFRNLIPPYLSIVPESFLPTTACRCFSIQCGAISVKHRA
jgi:hypothetical protein